MPTSPARRSGRPTSAEAAKLDNDLKEAALRLFLSRGYEGSSMADIASAAGTTKQSLYARFTSKEELFSAVLGWAVERSDWPSPQLEPAVDGSDLDAALRAIAHASVRRVLDPDMVALTRLASAQAERFPEVAHKTYRLWPRQRVVARLLREHAAKGDIQVDDADIMAEHFLGMVAVVPARMASMGILLSRRAQQKRTDTAVDLFMRALRPD